MTKRDAIACALLAGLVFAVHRAVLHQFWLWDDPQLLFGVIRYPLIDFYTSPQIWQQQSSTNFVPALLTAFKLDFHSAGLEPHTFYVHHLAMFTLAILAVYAYARMFTSEVTAAIAAATVTLSPPAHTIAGLLMNRHYAAGVVFALAALIAFRFSRPFTGSFLYLIAALEKEVFVPLPLIVLVQDIVAKRPWRTVLRNLMASGTTAAAYMAWRIVMLRSFGGYDRGRNTAEIARLPEQVWRSLTGFSKPSALLAVLLVVAILFAIALRRSPRSTLLVTVSAAIACLIPLAALRGINQRHVFVVVVVLMLCAAAAVGRSKFRELPFIVFASLSLLLISGGLQARRVARAEFDRMGAQGRYLWDSPPDAKPILTIPNGWYVEGVRWLRSYAKHDEAPRAIASVPGLFIAGIPPQSVTLVDRPLGLLTAELRDIANTYDPTLPVAVSVARRGQTFRWSFAPAGQWYYVSLPSYELIELDADGWTRLPTHLRGPTYDATPEAADFRVIRRVAGKWNVSRELPWPRDGQAYTWRTR